MMQPTPFKLLPCAGTYFQLADYSEISQQPDYEFAQWLTKNVGVATIPISAFYKNIDTSQKLVRFCFAKTNDTLEQATEKMAVYFK
jgi:methionine aminotransferase